MFKATLAVALLALVQTDTRYRPWNENQVHRMDQQEQGGPAGHLDPCTKNDPPFTLTWTPGVIRLGDTITIHFEMDPVVFLDGGKADLTVWLPGYEDPIYQATQDFTCDAIHKVFPNICPFKAKVPVKVPAYKFFVQPDWPLPGGKFKVTANATNKAGKTFVCMSGNIVISND